MGNVWNAMKKFQRELASLKPAGPEGNLRAEHQADTRPPRRKRRRPSLAATKRRGLRGDLECVEAGPFAASEPRTAVLAAEPQPAEPACAAMDEMVAIAEAAPAPPVRIEHEPEDSPPVPEVPVEAEAEEAPGVAEGSGRRFRPHDPQRYSIRLRVHHDRGGPITEEYRALRTSLLARSRDDRFSHIVTSANPGEGKTVTSLNLGLIMTERADRTTLVVDCDLRRRTMAGLLGADSGPGFTDLLRGAAALDDVIQPTAHANLWFLPSGKVTPGEVGELLGCPALNKIIAALQRRYDFTIFDTPPLGVASDAGVIGRAVRSAVLVVHMNQTHKESVERAIRLLRAGNVDVCGVVLTHRRFFIPNYLYRYS